MLHGRAPTAIENFATNLNATNYYISGNGALLYDMKNEEILYDNYMTKEKVLEIVKECERNSIYYNVYTKTEMIAKKLNYNILFYHYENSKKSEAEKANINIVEDVYQYIKDSNHKQFLKLTICDNHKIIFNNIMKKIKKIKDIDVLDVAHMSRKLIKSGTKEIEIEYFYTEISNPNVNKWKALQVLIDQLNISKEEVIAIGDNANDLEMIKNAGVGVAMNSSAPYIKEQADFITEDNNNSRRSSSNPKIYWIGLIVIQRRKVQQIQKNITVILQWY